MGWTRIQFGGLVGRLENAAVVTNSYATGRIEDEHTRIGGLIGHNDETANAEVTASYWDTDTSGQDRFQRWWHRQDDNGTANPDDCNRYLCEVGDPDSWDFSNPRDYPLLRYVSEVSGYDGLLCDKDPATQIPLCGSLLTEQRNKKLGGILLFADGVSLDESAFDKPFSYARFRYNVHSDAITTATTIQVNPYAVNPHNEIISITKGGNTSKDYFAGKRSGELSEDISLNTEGETSIEVKVADSPDDINPAVYTFIIIGTDGDLPVAINITGDSTNLKEGDRVTLSAQIIGGNNADYRYSWNSDSEGLLPETSTDTSVTISIPADFVGDGETTRNARFILTTESLDRTRTSKVRIVITVRKIDNGNPSFTPTVTTSTISIAGDDPDGNGATSEYTWETTADGVNWVEDEGDSTSSYSILPVSNIAYYRVRISSTDSQVYRSSVTIGPLKADLDNDDDGLIDIYYLEELNNVRHQTDGSGYKESSMATKITRGCPTTPTVGCKGYELRRNLDFNANESYMDAATNKAAWTVDDFSNVNDTGWNPIGTDRNSFTGRHLQWQWLYDFQSANKWCIGSNSGRFI